MFFLVSINSLLIAIRFFIMTISRRLFFGNSYISCNHFCSTTTAHSQERPTDCIFNPFHTESIDQWINQRVEDWQKECNVAEFVARTTRCCFIVKSLEKLYEKFSVSGQRLTAKMQKFRSVTEEET